MTFLRIPSQQENKMFVLNRCFCTQNHALHLTPSVLRAEQTCQLQTQRGCCLTWKDANVSLYISQRHAHFYCFSLLPILFFWPGCLAYRSRWRCKFCPWKCKVFPRGCRSRGDACTAGLGHRWAFLIAVQFVFHSQSQQNQALGITEGPERCHSRCLPAKSLSCQHRDPLNLSAQHHPCA